MPSHGIFDHHVRGLYDAALLVNARPMKDDGARDFWLYLRGNPAVLCAWLQTALPGATYDPATRHWRVPATAGNAQRLLRISEAWRLTVYPMARSWLRERSAPH